MGRPHGPCVRGLRLANFLLPGPMRHAPRPAPVPLHACEGDTGKDKPSLLAAWPDSTAQRLVADGADVAAVRQGWVGCGYVRTRVGSVVVERHVAEKNNSPLLCRFVCVSQCCPGFGAALLRVKH